MRKRIIRNVGIFGTGSYVPDRIVTNAELAKRVATSPEWIEKNLGIRERRIAAPNQATSDLAARAAARALESARMTADQIDLVIVATATPDRLSPATACIVQEKIGAHNAAAFDIGAVCSGFLYGLWVAAQFIAAGVYDNVLLIGADVFSRITDWDDRSCVYFGDGAGAAVVSRVADGEGLLAIDLYADGRGKWNFTVPAGGSEQPASVETIEQRLHSFRMNGRAVYEIGTEVLPKAIQEVWRRCEVTADQVDVLVPHQPSINILKATAERVGLPFEKVMTNMDRYANTAGATVAIVLDETHRQGRLRDGSIITFASVGSGWTWAAGVMRWETRA